MWSNPRTMNIAALALGIFAILAALFAAAMVSARAKTFAIRHVVVTGALKKVDPAYIERIARTELRGTFFTLNLETARRAFQRMPWVNNVSVRRVWPRTVEIQITEHETLARWNRDQLLSRDGAVFMANENDTLPQLSGPVGAEKLVAARFSTLTKSLAPLGYEITEVGLSASYSLTARAVNGATIEFGRDAFEMRLARLVNNFSQITKNVGPQLATVDLRYQKGIAVGLPTLRPSSPPVVAPEEE